MQGRGGSGETEGGGVTGLHFLSSLPGLGLPRRLPLLPPRLWACLRDGAGECGVTWGFHGAMLTSDTPEEGTSHLSAKCSSQRNQRRGGLSGTGAPQCSFMPDPQPGTQGPGRACPVRAGGNAPLQRFRTSAQ